MRHPLHDSGVYQSCAIAEWQRLSVFVILYVYHVVAGGARGHICRGEARGLAF
jgi:hypothetical protein